MTSIGNTYLAVDFGNVGIGTTTPRAKLDVDGDVYLGTAVTDVISVSGRLMYGSVARIYGIFSNGKVYCNSGVDFNTNNFICWSPVVDVVDSRRVETAAPLPLLDSIGTVLVGHLNAICYTLGGKQYIAYLATMQANNRRAYLQGIANSGGSPISWYVTTSARNVGFGSVTCEYGNYE